ncbi:SIR2 family protein [Treponema zuelzerae]|uniref:NAD(+) hydrolase ThsA n=1 Tax=Teretinema zuelzerae TaxID=156 RepID=A0AAE3JK39_9SPIR|nr:SIR2 family protein [Teretinema zuelzerae]MCD1656203.1 SIR2 family protein [Teretinema zuelzerae]
MKLDRDIESFINNYVKALKEKNAVAFIGSGMSVSQGFFDWKKLLKPVADKLGLDINDEQHDLTSLAQFFVDDHGGVRGELDQILVEEYGKTKMSVSDNHRILARLPIQIYWTTNYDRLIENALLEQGKTPDIKKAQSDLTVNLPKRDAIIYKMHGDIETVSETVLTKHEYEDYNKKRELFSNAFKSDYVSRTFLFIGFSFTDPNLDYLISRIRTTLGQNIKPDYYFIKKETDTRLQRRQELRANSLKKYGLNPLWINEYPEITTILKEVESRFLRTTILISGSAENYGSFGEKRAVELLHDLSKSLSNNSYKILTGFGWGVGSAVINGVLDNMESERNQNMDNYLIMRPFPQFETHGKNLKELWVEYRKRFIPLAGIAIFVFGNRKNKTTGVLEEATGVIDEFNIAFENGLLLIPIGATGFVSKCLWDQIIASFKDFFPNHEYLLDDFKLLGDTTIDNSVIIKTVLKIINTLNSRQ